MKAIEQTFGMIPICSVYQFGYRTSQAWAEQTSKSSINATKTRYYFVIITPSKPDVSMLTKKFAENSGGTATILVHKPTQLRTPCNRAFFKNIVSTGKLVYDNSVKLPMVSTPPEFSLSLAKSHWYKCEALADFYLDSATQSLCEEVEMIKVSQLHYAIQYACLGLIRLYLNYTPIRHDLKTLLELCGSFTELPFEALSNPRTNRVLCAPPVMLRVWDRLELNPRAYSQVQQACTEFIETARKLAATQLKVLTFQNPSPDDSRFFLRTA